MIGHGSGLDRSRIPAPGDPDGCGAGHPGSLHPPEAWPGPPALLSPDTGPQPQAGGQHRVAGGDRSGLEDHLARDAPCRLGQECLPGRGERVHRPDLRPELAGVNTTFRGATQQLFVDLDRNRAEVLGVPVQDAFQTMQSLFGSSIAGQFTQFSRVWWVVLQADAEYKTPFLRLPSTDPGYVRIDSQLMVAFAGIPKLETPTGPVAAPSRIFELRTYESHNKAAHRKKVEMFNQGEIDIFHRAAIARDVIKYAIDVVLYPDRRIDAGGNQPDDERQKKEDGEIAPCMVMRRAVFVTTGMVGKIMV